MMWVDDRSFAKNQPVMQVELHYNFDQNRLILGKPLLPNYINNTQVLKMNDFQLFLDY